MILAGELLADGTLHETRERGQDIDRRVYLPVVQLTIDEDLTLGDIPSKIGDRMCDV